jgi:hypothetical protein
MCLAFSWYRALRQAWKAIFLREDMVVVGASR